MPVGLRSSLALVKSAPLDWGLGTASSPSAVADGPSFGLDPALGSRDNT